MEMSASEIEIEKAAHDWSRILATWRLCDKPACRRARVCRGAGRACLKEKFPQLPTAAREWFMGYVWHRLEQFTFEEAMANLEAATFAPAFHDWREEGIAHYEAGRGEAAADTVPN